LSAFANPLELLAAQAKPAAPATKIGHPDPKTFAAGDLLWPSLPNTRIVYDKAAAGDAEDAWEKERAEFLQSLPDNEDGRALRATLQNMSYRDFSAMFMQGRTKAQLREKGADLPRFSVGHVAIVDIDSKGKKWVVEAMPKTDTNYRIVYGRFPNGVIATPYNEWIKHHAKYNVWHGRIKVKGKDKRANIAKVAQGFKNRDYWIWALNFSDESAFYCSKLVWVSAYKALGVALDDDKTLKRRLWFSPKKLMTLSNVEMRYSPGDYGK
jgi:hypothetical protein